MRSIDLEALRTFMSVAETQSFTATGEMLGATQSAVSMRIRKLEEQLDRRLLDRTPRRVALTRFGEAFLADARRLIATHDDILSRAIDARAQAPIALGVTEHAAGDTLTLALAKIRRAALGVQLRLSIEPSAALLEGFEVGRYDGVILRQPSGGAGRLLFRDHVEWMAADPSVWRPGEPVPLVSISAPCGLRRLATETLEAAGHSWIDACVGGGVTAAAAAIAAGFGVGCLDRRYRPPGVMTLGAASGLPSLRSTDIVFRRRDVEPARARLLDTFADAFVSAEGDADAARAMRLPAASALENAPA